MLSKDTEQEFFWCWCDHNFGDNCKRKVK